MRIFPDSVYGISCELLELRIAGRIYGNAFHLHQPSGTANRSLDHQHSRVRRKTLFQNGVHDRRIAAVPQINDSLLQIRQSAR